MERVPSRQFRRQHESVRAAHVGKLDRVDLVDDGQQHVERIVDRLPTLDRDVAMEDLLCHLGAGDQPLA
jgi:hypothetical protein